MKALRTFCAPLALLAGAALVYATSFTWTGAQNSNWNGHNWTPNTGFPDDSSDSARIDVNTNNPVSFSTGTYTIDTLALDASTNGQSASMTVSVGSLTTNGRTSLTGQVSSTNTATLTVSGGTFAPNTMSFQGDNGHAIGHIDVDVTVGATTSSTVIYGNVDIDIASTKTFAAKDVGVGSATAPVDLNIGIGGTPGTGEFDCTAMRVEVGNGGMENAVVHLNGGTLDVNGLFVLKSSASVDAVPQLIVASGTTFSPDQLYLEGGNSAARAALITVNANVTVGASGTQVTGYGQASVSSGVTLHTGDLTIGDGTNIGNFEKLSGATGAISATQIIIYGGSSDSSTMTVSAGSIVTE